MAGRHPIQADEVAVARFLRDRSEAAFDELYRAHTGFMFGVAMRLIANRREDAEDAVHEAWLRAIAALPRFAWRSSLRTWLCGFVVNCCREIMRRPSTTEIIETSFLTTDTIDVERAIATIPPAAREVFVLHEIYGYTHDEIGEIAAIDAGTSKSQLHHARLKFRAYFEDQDGRNQPPVQRAPAE